MYPIASVRIRNDKAQISITTVCDSFINILPEDNWPRKSLLTGRGYDCGLRKTAMTTDTQRLGRLLSKNAEYIISVRYTINNLFMCGMGRCGEQSKSSRRARIREAGRQPLQFGRIYDLGDSLSDKRRS